MSIIFIIFNLRRAGSQLGRKKVIKPLQKVTQ